LSAYPDHDSEPSSPIDPARNAQHPDHLNDVTRALVFLEKTYGIGGRYVLVGHSCGATLAFQIPETDGAEKVPQPTCIIGSEGIYDLPSLLAVHQDSSSYYRQFIVSAFGGAEDAWAEASPALVRAGAIWEGTDILLISHSDEDEYVEKEQSLEMLEHISKTKRGRGQAAYVPVHGKHDEIHETGRELARIITLGLKSV
jgi:kynurenine formamidase